MTRPNRTSIAADLRALGLRPGALVMVHSAFRSLGAGDPELIIGALLDLPGPAGTLLMPARSYLQQSPAVHATRATPATRSPLWNRSTSAA